MSDASRWDGHWIWARGGQALAVILGLGFVTHLAYDYAVNGPTAEAAEKGLLAESALLDAPPQVTKLDCHHSSKPGQALVGCTYRSALSFAQLETYYDDLFSHGRWSRCDSTVPASHQQRFLAYCRDDYRAELQYGGGGGDWDYAVDLTWHAK